MVIEFYWGERIHSHNYRASQSATLAFLVSFRFVLLPLALERALPSSLPASLLQCSSTSTVVLGLSEFQIRLNFYSTCWFRRVSNSETENKKQNSIYLYKKPKQQQQQTKNKHLLRVPENKNTEYTNTSNSIRNRIRNRNRNRNRSRSLSLISHSRLYRVFRSCFEKIYFFFLSDSTSNSYRELYIDAVSVQIREKPIYKYIYLHILLYIRLDRIDRTIFFLKCYKPPSATKNALLQRYALVSQVLLIVKCERPVLVNSPHTHTHQQTINVSQHSQFSSASSISTTSSTSSPSSSGSSAALTAKRFYLACILRASVRDSCWPSVAVSDVADIVDVDVEVDFCRWPKHSVEYNAVSNTRWKRRWNRVATQRQRQQRQRQQLQQQQQQPYLHSHNQTKAEAADASVQNLRKKSK
ncbi:PREDICTED: uncharacterized protein LOC108618122 [Drosophila arizonae]|uniref:Uncharacterized protein LOC108618122 n=1 Tax=Drosophila arizonae TaxID=7263 RepID=A0ABM1PQN0_DROAR|nr:PREDICTED: uncharacterized protein LOC108618122 [Drosophila arizonae]